jgi:tRNA-splicing ligase RtcB
MRNCMAVGNVVGGIICADGHLGYAQPVGGVIAYQGQISISGVGFDIGCGNMAVRLDTPVATIKKRRTHEIAPDGCHSVRRGAGLSTLPAKTSHRR